jgi:superoxide dismutase
MNLEISLFQGMNWISTFVVRGFRKHPTHFKEKMKIEAMKIQGSGWIYMARNGEIKTIKNHQIKNDIALLIDWWEHAWAKDYGADKAKYFDRIWRIINWDKVNSRIASGK